MTTWRSDAPARFSASAADYAATMAPSLLPIARRVVQAAQLQPGERVLDLGTGTGNAAGLATGDGREVVGLDGAPAMLEIARRVVPGATFVEGDFTGLPFPDQAFDVVISCHALHFAEDPTVTLAAWRRVTRAGGRLSLSVPGPWEATMGPIFDPIYRRYQLPGREFPTSADLRRWARAAGWRDARTSAMREAAISLADEAAFRRWLVTGTRGGATAGWTADRRARFTQELLAAAPRTDRGALRLPFGAVLLTARRDERR